MPSFIFPYEMTNSHLVEQLRFRYQKDNVQLSNDKIHISIKNNKTNNKILSNIIAHYIVEYCQNYVISRVLQHEYAFTFADASLFLVHFNIDNGVDSFQKEVLTHISSDIQSCFDCFEINIKGLLDFRLNHYKKFLKEELKSYVTDYYDHDANSFYPMMNEIYHKSDKQLDNILVVETSHGFELYNEGKYLIKQHEQLNFNYMTEEDFTIYRLFEYLPSQITLQTSYIEKYAESNFVLIFGDYLTIENIKNNVI